MCVKSEQKLAGLTVKGKPEPLQATLHLLGM